MESKNLQTASILNGGQQTDQIKNVCEFIQKTMETLSTYELRKAISRAAHYRDDLEGNVINLSKAILSIQQKFEFLIHDPRYEHMKIVNGTIETFHHQQVFAKSIANNLKTTNVKAPHFYITPKVHKKYVPGRSLVSSIDCHTSKLSKFVDYYLQPHVKAPPSYVKDTTDFINKFQNIKDTSKDSILVALAVKALYTNIPNHEGNQ